MFKKYFFVYNINEKRFIMEKSELKREISKLNDQILDLWRSL